jgi:hypothetical protein
MKESDLFEPVKKFLIQSGCSSVYGEVSNCDVLGINEETNMIVELKTSLSFKLIDQAIERTRQGQYVYIAIPKRKNGIPRCVKEILTIHHIGLLEIGTRSLRVTIPATYNPLADKRNAYKRLRRNIREHNLTQIGGVKSGEGVTEYSITIKNIKEFLTKQQGEWVTVDDILAHCETHYKNPKTSIMATLRAEWNMSWCESTVIKRKRYFKLKEELIV